MADIITGNGKSNAIRAVLAEAFMLDGGTGQGKGARIDDPGTIWWVTDSKPGPSHVACVDWAATTPQAARSMLDQAEEVIAKRTEVLAGGAEKNDLPPLIIVVDEAAEVLKQPSFADRLMSILMRGRAVHVFGADRHDDGPEAQR